MTHPTPASKLGFIGVRRGVSLPQFQTLCRLLVNKNGRGAVTGVEFAHLSNDGWGQLDFTRITKWMKKPPTIIIHDCGGKTEEPSPNLNSIASWDEFTLEAESIPLWNREIIDESDTILACPPIANEEPRSRTWSAIRYAQRSSKHLVIVYPNGRVEAGGQEYYLVSEKVRGETISVFLCRNPRINGSATVSSIPVFMETLPIQDRTEAVRPILGRSRQNPNRFREFRTRNELDSSGFVAVGSYRVCDSWDDYHFPWSGSSSILNDPIGLNDTDSACNLNGTDPIFSERDLKDISVEK